MKIEDEKIYNVDITILLKEVLIQSISANVKAERTLSELAELKLMLEKKSLSDEEFDKKFHSYLDTIDSQIEKNYHSVLERCVREKE